MVREGMWWMARKVIMWKYNQRNYFSFNVPWKQLRRGRMLRQWKESSFRYELDNSTEYLCLYNKYFLHRLSCQQARISIIIRCVCLIIPLSSQLVVLPRWHRQKPTLVEQLINAWMNDGGTNRERKELSSIAKVAVINQLMLWNKSALHLFDFPRN